MKNGRGDVLSEMEVIYDLIDDSASCFKFIFKTGKRYLIHVCIAYAEHLNECVCIVAYRDIVALFTSGCVVKPDLFVFGFVVCEFRKSVFKLGAVFLPLI